MFEHDRSAARGLMATRKVVVFKHAAALGNAPAHQLFERVRIECRNKPPRQFSDYAVTVNKADLPSGVEVIEMV
jgi:CRISPR-associated protein Csd2